MADTTKKPRCARRQFDDAFKVEAVCLVLGEGTTSISSVALDLDLTESNPRISSSHRRTLLRCTDTVNCDRTAQFVTASGRHYAA
jgi:transposase-like protein